MNFAHVVFGEGEHKDKGFKNLYDDATPEQKKLMIHFRKRIFDV
ncbi:MAG: hypothetical protein [Siphoviridae sp. ctCJE6]|nr:MAG: hypothetical protein [Siphoviridae sp. ctCJE6]